MKKYKFTCVKPNRLDVRTIFQTFTSDKVAETYATVLMREFNYERITVEEIREVFEIKGEVK